MAQPHSSEARTAATEKKEGGTVAQDHDFKRGNKYRWKPGECGNPSGIGSGRPSKNLQKIAEEFGSETFAKSGKTRDEHLIDVIYRKACQGSPRHAEMYLNYRYG